MYKIAKQYLKNAADLIKQTNPKDRPMIRMHINDVCDSIIKDTINCPSWNISDLKREQYADWLHSYACTLHPKN
jgi:hypothetical protein